MERVSRVPVHPPPNVNGGESIGTWIETLAKANHTHFKVLFNYVEHRARKVGLCQALSDLTGFPTRHISRLANEFKSNFWEDPAQCPFRDCHLQFARIHNLFAHLGDAHGLGLTWHPCPHCDYKAKSGGNLVKHLTRVHDIGVKWHHCPSCDFKGKLSEDLTRHLAQVHNIHVKWCPCPHCDYKAKSSGDLSKHLARIHDIGVKWHHCSHCDYKAKSSGDLSKHLANIHDIGVKWHHCPHCKHKTKFLANLKCHIRRRHKKIVEKKVRFPLLTICY
jgi:hypothetical protein